MDIGSYSDQQLIQCIIFIVATAIILGLLFIGSTVVEARRRLQQRSNKKISTSNPTSGDWLETMRQQSVLPPVSPKPHVSIEPPPPASQKIAQTQLAKEEAKTTMSLLKSSGKKITPSGQQSAQNNAQVAVDQDGYQELLRVLVKPGTNKIVVEVDGQRFQAISEVNQRHIGQRILEVVAALLRFTNGFIATATGTKSIPVPEVKLTALPLAKPASQPNTAQKSLPVGQSSAGGLASRIKGQQPAPSQPPVQQPQPQPRPEPIHRPPQQPFSPPPATPQPSESRGGFWSLGRSSTQESEPESDSLLSFNLAGEIDTIVQRKLLVANEPTTVKIHSGLGGMIQIQVGDIYYQSVDEVAEPHIKALIQSAIKEWERS